MLMQENGSKRENVLTLFIVPRTKYRESKKQDRRPRREDRRPTLLFRSTISFGHIQKEATYIFCTVQHPTHTCRKPREPKQHPVRELRCSGARSSIPALFIYALNSSNSRIHLGLGRSGMVGVVSPIRPNHLGLSSVERV